MNMHRRFSGELMEDACRPSQTVNVGAPTRVCVGLPGMAPPQQLRAFRHSAHATCRTLARALAAAVLLVVAAPKAAWLGTLGKIALSQAQEGATDGGC